jgi:biopolymer transport protein ExbD
MKIIMQAGLVAAVLLSLVSAQALKKGVSVQLASASHAVEMRAADEPNARVVAITADGKVYSGIDITEPAALSSLADATVYVKADARAPYQKVLAVLDALRGKSVVLLTASPGNAARQGVVPPYGLKLTLSR